MPQDSNGSAVSHGIRPLLNSLQYVLLLSRVNPDNYGALTIMERRRTKFERYQQITGLILVRLTTRHSNAELLGIVSNTGMFPIFKRIRKFLRSIHGNIADLPQQDKDRLCRALDQSGSTKNRLIGVLALIVLFDRPPEYMTALERLQVANIKQKMRNSLLNPDVVEFLQQMLFLQNLSMAPDT